MKNILYLIAVLFLLISCSEQKSGNVLIDGDLVGTLPGDKALYGYACDGSTDSVFVVLPLDCSDPISFNIIQAMKDKQVKGRARVGDWVCVLPNDSDSTVADLVINLEELKGTWCYIVMPHLRKSDNMSIAEEKRMINEMPDSLKENYFLPREYGFSLKRQWQANSVGYVRPNSVLEEESPVEYPRLSYFSEWHMWNGKLIMTSGTPVVSDSTKTMEVTNLRNDTCDILFLQKDSLVLGSEGETRSYYRQGTESSINAKANAIADKLRQQSLEDLKE